MRMRSTPASCTLSSKEVRHIRQSLNHSHDHQRALMTMSAMLVSFRDTLTLSTQKLSWRRHQHLRLNDVLIAVQTLVQNHRHQNTTSRK